MRPKSASPPWGSRASCRNLIRLSGGEQQRLCLIRCLAVKPKVLLLDESLSGLDDTAAEALLTLVRHALPDTAVLLITHQSGLISRADTVLTLT